MKKWKDCPLVLRRKVFFTLLMGLLSITASFIIYVISADHVLLGLGGLIFIFCLFRGGALWRVVTRQDYEIISGICVGAGSLPLQKYRRVRILDENGRESTLLLNKQARINIGIRYCFYFQKYRQPVFGNEYLDASLSTDTFLGYEELGKYE